MVNTEYWGPGTWCLLYSVAETQTIEDTISFIHSLSKVLPCDECKKHFNEYIEKNPPKDNLKVWINTFHNSVRGRLRKNSIPLTTIEKKLNPPIIPKRIKTVPRRINIIHSTVKHTPVLPKKAPILRSPAPQPRKGCGCGGKK